MRTKVKKRFISSTTQIAMKGRRRDLSLRLITMEGTIKNLTDKGFGFITVEGEEKDLFFHKNELKGITYEELKVGDRVSFEKADSPKGPNATNVARV